MTNLSQTLKAFREKFTPKSRLTEKPITQDGKTFGVIYENQNCTLEDIESFLSQSIKSACEEMIVEEYLIPSGLSSEEEEEVGAYKAVYDSARQDQLERFYRILTK